MKILLSGANGLLGGAIQQVAIERGYTCTSFSRAGLSWQDNLVNFDQFLGADVVIHAAANTDVEQCEKFPIICYRDNTLFSEYMVRMTARACKKFVFISSTGIYGSHKTVPYSEFDVVDPSTHNHRSKLLAEQSILRFYPDSLIIRTGWLFGGSANLPKNFVARRIEEARDAVSGAVFSNQEQYGTPCYNINIATRIMELLERGMCGVFNSVNNGSASRFEYVRSILEFAGLPTIVVPSHSGTFNRLAKVSNNEAALNWKAEMLGFAAMPAWQVSLADYIKTQLLPLGHNL